MKLSSANNGLKIQNMCNRNLGEEEDNVEADEDVISFNLESAQCEDKVLRILHKMCKFHHIWPQQTS
jgi:hypothetical protein